ncbi:MAG: hypothetical protein ACQEW2_11930 [Bacillota bacterium]
MREENKRFVLYEYLMYFWKRKHYFLIVPIITMLLVGGAVYFLKKDMPYTGQAVVYTGSVNSPDLTDPENVLAKFDDKDQQNLDVIVSSKNNVKFTKKGDTQEEVKTSLNNITKTYLKELNANYKSRLKASKKNLKNWEKREDALNNAMESYRKDLSIDLPPVQYDALNELIIETDRELSDARKTVSRMTSDLEFFEKPKILSENVTKSKSYLKEGAAIGLILGLVLTVALLALMKYLSEGRRYYND